MFVNHSSSFAEKLSLFICSNSFREIIKCFSLCICQTVSDIAANIFMSSSGRMHTDQHSHYITSRFSRELEVSNISEFSKP